jgi:hypothetical protein
VHAKVIVGGSNPHLSVLTETVATLPGGNTRIELVSNPPDMYEVMDWADLAISSAGSTTWELAFMGVPNIQIVFAENQRQIAEECDKLGLSRYLGDAKSLTSHKVTAAVESLIGDRELREKQSRISSEVVDGFGAHRVSAALGRSFRVSLLSDKDSWICEYIPELKTHLESLGHQVDWINEPSQLPRGDIAFFLSLSRIVPIDLLCRNTHNLVVHESALPKGRGWSPLTWQILEGKQEVPVTLFEAVAELDAGDIYEKTHIRLEGGELVAEIRKLQADATMKLCCDFVNNYPFVISKAQKQIGKPLVWVDGGETPFLCI